MTKNQNMRWVLLGILFFLLISPFSQKQADVQGAASTVGTFALDNITQYATTNPGWFILIVALAGMVIFWPNR